MHVITQSGLLFILINTLNTVTAEDCKLADFLSSSHYDSNLNTSGLASSYAPATKVRVSCNAGFVGFFNLRCMDDGWYHQGSKCEQLICAPPPRIDNGNVLGNTTLYYKDQTLRFWCDRKYKPIHPMPPKCTRVGIRAEWIPTPLCVPVTCPLTTVPATRYEPDARRQFPPDDTVTVTCDSGYSIGSPREDTKVITCLDTGEWESSPVCEEITCFNPRLETGVAWHNDWMGRNRKLGNTVSYTCSRGYKATDVRRTATCTRDGWAPKPLCEEIICTKPNIPNAEIENPQKVEYKYGEKVNYRCFQERGTRQASCDRDGWNGIQQCAVPCEVPELPANLSITNQHQPSPGKGDKLQFRCSGRLYLQGSVEIECLANGNWSDEFPICSESNHCGQPPILEDGDVKHSLKSQYDYGENMSARASTSWKVEVVPA